MAPTNTNELRELDSRTSDGIEIRLLWSAADDQVVVAVADSKTGDAFEILVERGEDALEVFHHPYAHAAFRRIDFSEPAPALRG